MPKIEKRTFKLQDKDGKITEHSINISVATKEENLEGLRTYPFCICVINYFATGEGTTMYLLASRAESEESFRAWATGKTDPYWMIGASIYINELPPEEDHVWGMLASTTIKKLWADIIDGEAESGNYQFVAHQHMNLS